MLEEAIQFYHDLLTPDVAEEIDAHMRSRQQDESLYFGDRPLCVVLRPHFYTLEQWRYMKHGLERLLKAFYRLHRALLDSPTLRRHLRLDEYEEILLPLERATVPPWTSSRLDTFFVADNFELKVVEYNAETPAGIGYADTLSKVFNEFPVMRQFKKHYNMSYIRSLGSLTDALISGYRAWGGVEANPQIGILDWSEVPTLNEHEITRHYFEQQGYRAVLADPRSLDYRDGHLYAGDFRIDMIYKRVLFSELVKLMGVEGPVLRAVRDGNVYITNSVGAKMLSKKASLALLSDERYADLYTKEHHDAIREFIPWTRIVEERKTLYNGEEVDLIEFVSENRDRFTLKPNDDYGGAGVMLGWQASADAWDSKLKHALETPHVVQEKVTVVERDFPGWINGALDVSPRYVDADPYVFGGEVVGGVMTRLSSAALLNVTAGGGSVVPTCLIEEK